MTSKSPNLSPFAEAIFKQKYSKDGESWEGTAKRVVRSVMESEEVRAVADVPESELIELERLIANRQFLPGGRYLYAAGRELHQVNNCLLMRAEDSREGWAKLMKNITMALMTGAGVGVDYSAVRAEGSLIGRTGGLATGPLALMQMVNEAGRHIMQGGARRSALWAGLNWKHPDVMKFIAIKDWSDEYKKSKEKDFNAYAPLDGTNISVILDSTFFDSYSKGDPHAHAVYKSVVAQMCRTGEPGFSVDVDDATESLRNACVPGETEILTDSGYQRIDRLVGQAVKVWNGFEWSEVTPKITGHRRPLVRVSLSDGRSLVCTPDHKWVTVEGYAGRGQREFRVNAANLTAGSRIIKNEFPVIKTGVADANAYSQGFISGDGMDGYGHLSLYEPKFICEGRLNGTTGAVYDTGTIKRKQLRFRFEPRPKDYVPVELDLQGRLDWFAGLLDSDGTELKEGGAQVCSVNLPFLLGVQKMLSTVGAATKVTKMRDAGFSMYPDGRGGKKEYPHQDTYRLLIGAAQIQELVGLGLKCERLEFDKSPNRDATRFVTVVSVEDAGTADTVYCFNEPLRHLGCFNGIVTGQCTEITSSDDSDICNLGSLNLARFDSIEEFRQAVRLGTMFLMGGTLYSHVPYETVKEVRNKNRRLGLGIMGVHEWLLKRGKVYGPDAELGEWLQVYQDESREAADEVADQWAISKPVKVRACAPTGTIGIIAETSTGIEPIFCVAYRRRYKGPNGTDTFYQYVVDPTAKRLLESGIDEKLIEDSYVLAEDVERRLSFQVFVQRYIDHGISSTINMPQWGSEGNNEKTLVKFRQTLMKYLPYLRGITVYPDASRGGQPLVRVNLSTALGKEGQVFVEQADVCDLSGKGGTCGS